MKLLLLAIILSVPAQAGQIIFNLRGEQFSELVGPGGGVSSDAQVVWDTSKDGPLPADAPVGFAERYEVEEEHTRDKCSVVEGNRECVPEKYTVRIPKLRESADMKSAKAARDAAKAAADAAKAQDESDFKALAVKVKAETASAAEVRRALKLLLKRMGE